MTPGLSKLVEIATDHIRFGLKEELVAQPRAAGHEVVDFGAHGLDPGATIPISPSPRPRLWLPGQWNEV